MKKSRIYLLAILALLFVACDSTIEVTGVSLDQTTLSVALGSEGQLTATIQPKGAEGEVVWASSNEDVATVVDGLVTGVSMGTANITATVGSFVATCAVTITERTDFSHSLTGSEYYPIILDNVTAAALASKIALDLRPDEITRFLYIWEGTFTAGESVGPNFYGEVEPWMSLTVATSGWSGAGFFVSDASTTNALTNITANPSDYTLHIGIKSKDNATHVFGMEGQSNARFAIGSSNFNDNGTIYEPIADFTRDGEWHEIEVPLTTIVQKGLLYSTGMGSKNVLSVLSGGVTGTSLELDAVFIYKK